MRKAVHFTYAGQAPSKSNYRHSRSSRRQWARIKQFESEIAERCWEAQGFRPFHAYEGPVKVTLRAYKQRADASNIEKSLLDALQGVAYANDRQVECHSIPRRDDGPARLEITVEWGSVEVHEQLKTLLAIKPRLYWAPTATPLPLDSDWQQLC